MITVEHIQVPGILRILLSCAAGALGGALAIRFFNWKRKR
jgi:hypothetical protein